MKTVVLGEPPAELAKLIANRRAIGADLYDEVWEGDYHMAPAPSGPHARLDQVLAVVLERYAKPAGLFVSGAFNLGDSGDYRVPDRGVHRSEHLQVWIPTAAVAVEIVSPSDEIWSKLGFYANHDVDELLIVDPRTKQVTLLGLARGGYEPIGRSLLDVAADELAAQIDWPPVD